MLKKNSLNNMHSIPLSLMQMQDEDEKEDKNIYKPTIQHWRPRKASILAKKSSKPSNSKSIERK